MKCVYIRQCLERGVIQYLSSPEEFVNVPEIPYYKDIVNTVPTDNEEKKFYIFSLGHEYSDPTKRLINRVYKNSFIMHYVVKGKGTYNGIPIEQGSTFFCWPGIAHSLITDKDDPLEFYWAFLRGSEMLINLSRYGFTSSMLHADYTWEKDIVGIFDMALYTPHNDTDLGEYFMGILKLLMSFHKNMNNKSPFGTLSMQDQYIIGAKNLMTENHYAISVETLAMRIGISRKYFSVLFKKSTGYSPQEYMARNSIEVSKSMLASGKYRVSDIAEMLGYSDYTAFSRAFTKYVGTSPSEYAGIRKASQDNM